MRACSILLLLALVGCEDEEPPPAPTPEPEAPIAPTRRRPLPAHRQVSARGAFDLVATDSGAMLVYGQPVTSGGLVRALPLTRAGEVAGEERVVGAPQTASVDVVEVSAASGSGRVAIVWVWRAPARRQAVVSMGDDGARAFSPVELLAEMRDEGAGTRGRVAAAGSPSGELAVAYRIGEVPCEEGSSARCQGLRIRRVAPASNPRSVPLAVPEPCPRTWVGFEQVEGTWYYGACDRSQGTMIYAIQFEPEYAHVEPHFQGCEPRGLAPFQSGVVALADCEEGRRGVVVPGAEATRVEFIGEEEVTVGCAGDTPAMTVVGIRTPLDAPRSGLALFLPESIAPVGSRAAWTGEAILVAHTTGGEVGLHRWECRDGVLAPTDAD